MKLSEFKSHLNEVQTLSFQLPNGKSVPEHFHITEIGNISKHFIDCGGKERNENKINFQLWSANDYDHRLSPNKLLRIIELSESVLSLQDLEIEVEYQADTIGKYGLEFTGKTFLLTSLQTDCLAKDECGIPQEKPTVQLSTLNQNNCCSPEDNCC